MKNDILKYVLEEFVNLINDNRFYLKIRYLELNKEFSFNWCVISFADNFVWYTFYDTNFRVIKDLKTFDKLVDYVIKFFESNNLEFCTFELVYRD